MREGRDSSRDDSKPSHKSVSTITSCCCSPRLVSIIPAVPEDEDDPMDLLSPKEGPDYGVEDSSDDSDRYEPEDDIDNDDEDREEQEGRGGREKHPGRGDITAVRNTTTAFSTPFLSSGTAEKCRADLQGYVYFFFRCLIDLPFQWNGTDQEDQVLSSLRAQPRLDKQEGNIGLCVQSDPQMLRILRSSMVGLSVMMRMTS